VFAGDNWARRSEDLTYDKTDDKDAILIARLTAQLTAQLRCYAHLHPVLVPSRGLLASTRLPTQVARFRRRREPAYPRRRRRRRARHA
jgi:hypothetical protein